MSEEDLLFEARPASLDLRFTAIRDREQYSQLRAELEGMWRRFEPYADPHFRDEFATQFWPRWWEMSLAFTLLNLGFALDPRRDSEGPDLKVCAPSGARALVEAVAVGPGEGADRVPEPRSDEAQVVPDDRIALRIRSAMHTKNNQRRDWVERGVVPHDSAFVLAVSVGDIVSAHTNGLPPLSAKSCLGVGGLLVRIDPGGRGETVLMPRRSVRKHSTGTDIETDIFLADEFSDISGLLVSAPNPFWIPADRGGFEFLHNGRAAASARLPRHWFPRGIEYWLETGRLASHDHGSSDGR